MSGVDEAPSPRLPKLLPLDAGMFQRGKSADQERQQRATAFFTEISVSLRKALRDLGEGDPKVELDGLSDRQPPAINSVGWCGFQSNASQLRIGFCHDKEFAYALCDYCLGGGGFDAASGETARPLSKIEQTLSQHVIGKGLATIPEILHRLTEGRAQFRPDIKQGNALPEKPHHIARVSISARFLLNLFGYCGELQLSIDREELLAALDTGPKPMLETPPAKHDKAHFFTHVLNLQTEIKAQLPPQRIGVTDLMALKAGRMLHLETGPNSPVILSANGTRLRQGKLTSKMSNIAVILDD